MAARLYLLSRQPRADTLLEESRSPDSYRHSIPAARCLRAAGESGDGLHPLAPAGASSAVSRVHPRVRGSPVVAFHPKPRSDLSGILGIVSTNVTAQVRPNSVQD